MISQVQCNDLATEFIHADLSGTQTGSAANVGLYLCGTTTWDCCYFYVLSQSALVAG